jgi:hypothetical protein
MKEPHYIYIYYTSWSRIYYSPSHPSCLVETYYKRYSHKFDFTSSFLHFTLLYEPGNSILLSDLRHVLIRIRQFPLELLARVILFIFSTFSFIWVLEVITTVMTTPYPFYFVVVPREASNLSEVRFGDIAVLKQFSVLHRKTSWKFSVYLSDLRFLVHMPQVISKLSLVEHVLIWATENPLKNRPLSAVLFWKISATICVCLSIAFFLSSFDHGTFGEFATVVYAIFVVVLC